MQNVGSRASIDSQRQHRSQPRSRWTHRGTQSALGRPAFEDFLGPRGATAAGPPARHRHARPTGNAPPQRVLHRFRATGGTAGRTATAGTSVGRLGDEHDAEPQPTPTALRAPTPRRWTVTDSGLTSQQHRHIAGHDERQRGRQNPAGGQRGPPCRPSGQVPAEASGFLGHGPPAVRPAYSYSWNFGDGSGDQHGARNPSHTYSNRRDLHPRRWTVTDRLVGRVKTASLDRHDHGRPPIAATVPGGADRSDRDGRGPARSR